MRYTYGMKQELLPGITDIAFHLGRIRNAYWFIRRLRVKNGAEQRALYRRVLKHKKALLEAGLDGEWLRLYCRYLARPIESRERNLLRYAMRMQDAPKLF